MGLEIFWIGVALIAVWHTIKQGAPRAFRAVGKQRRASIDKWTAEHPTAPKSGRWLRGAAYSVTALRWGPGHVKREFAAAWREGWTKGKSKFRPEQYVQPNSAALCPDCNGAGLKRGQPCPSCFGHDESAERRYQAGCRQCNANSDWLTEAGAEAWRDAHVCPDPADPAARQQPPVRPDGRPDLRPVPHPSTTDTPSPQTRSDDMPIQTATGGEITNAEQFYAEAKAIESEAAAELEDASGDSSRAQEDLARIERMVASLSKQAAVKSDIAAVAALKEPAAARAQAAKDRHAAAERRLAEAKNVAAIAAKHLQLIGIATGPFYNPRG